MARADYVDFLLERYVRNILSELSLYVIHGALDIYTNIMLFSLSFIIKLATSHLAQDQLGSHRLGG